MKTLLIIIGLMLIAFGSIHCQPTNINVNVNWQADPTAQSYKIIVWSGADTTQTELTENKSLQDVNLQKVTVYDVAPNQNSLSFQSPIDGKYIHVAGVIVGGFGITSLLTVTNFQKKPDVPNKMQFLEFNLTL